MINKVIKLKLLTVFFVHVYVHATFKMIYHFASLKLQTFDLLILKIMFLFFKNTVKILKFR